MGSAYFSHGDVEEIKRHIDCGFAEFQRDMERKRQLERDRISNKRHSAFLVAMLVVLVPVVVYNCWDLWRTLFGA